MSNIILSAEVRKDLGKGASRRLRRMQDHVPGIIYGGAEAPLPVLIPQNKLKKALEDEAIYSSILQVNVNNTTEHVLLKSLQRHPYKPLVLHFDLQRVSPNDRLTVNVPLHFLNETKSPGVQSGGIIHHSMNHLEVHCTAKDLPEFIEVDVAQLGLEQVLHLTDLKLPKGVSLAVDVTDAAHNHPVVSIHKPKTQAVSEETVSSASELPAEPTFSPESE